MPDLALQPGELSAIEALRDATRSRDAELAANAPKCRLFAGDCTLSDRYEALWASSCLDPEKNGKSEAEAIYTAAVAIFDGSAAWLSKPLPPGGRSR